MGDVASHDKVTIGVDGVRIASDDGAARSIALLVLAVAMVALAAGLLLEGRPETAPARSDEPASHHAAPARAASSDAPELRPEGAARRTTRPPSATRPMPNEAMLRPLRHPDAKAPATADGPRMVASALSC
jgi:hypothetical protein